MKSVWNDIARTYFLQRNFQKSVLYAKEHLERNPEDAEAWLNLGKALISIEYFAEAEEALLKACALSGRPDYFLDLQVLYSLWGQDEKYGPIVERLKQEIPNEPRLIFNCAWDRMKAGETYEGFSDLEVGRQLGFFGSCYDDWPDKRLTNLDDIKGHTIAIIGEGGLGDEIITARFVALVNRYGGTPVLVCRKALHSILAHLAECRGVPGEYDYYIPGMASVALFKEIPNEVYLYAKPEFVEKHKIASTKKKVGICWHGNTSYEWEQIRGVPKEMLYSLASNDVDVFSLQQDDTDLDLSTWDDTLGVLANLDMLVSSCTSVVHAAGALGKRVLDLSPLAPYYPWITKEKWYPDVTVLRKNPKYGFDINEIKRWICQ